MGKLEKAAVAAAMACLPFAASAENIAEKPITTTTTNNDAGISGDAVVRLHPATLGNGSSKFNELPELGVNINLGDKVRLVFAGDIKSPAGENLMTHPHASGTKFTVGDAFFRFQTGENTNVNVGQFMFLYGQDFGEPWLQSGGTSSAPQILDETPFSYHGIPLVRGIQIEHSHAVSETDTIYMTAAGGKNEASDKLQAMGLIRYTRGYDDGASLSLAGQYSSRTGAQGGTEQGLFGMLQGKKPLNDVVSVRGDLEIGKISAIGGESGKNGTYIGARGFADFALSDRASAYAGLGAFKEAAGESYQAVEGGLAYKLSDRLTIHGGAGYANGGFAKGVSTTTGLTYGVKF